MESSKLVDFGCQRPFVWASPTVPSAPLIVCSFVCCFRWRALVVPSSSSSSLYSCKACCCDLSFLFFLVGLSGFALFLESFWSCAFYRRPVPRSVLSTLAAHCGQFCVPFFILCSSYPKQHLWFILLLLLLLVLLLLLLRTGFSGLWKESEKRIRCSWGEEPGQHREEGRDGERDANREGREGEEKQGWIVRLWTTSYLGCLMCGAADPGSRSSCRRRRFGSYV